jgi:hypothetical protein
VNKKALNEVGEVKSLEEDNSFSSQPNEDLKAIRKEALDAVKSIINVASLEEEAPIQTPKKALTRKAATKKGGKKGTRKHR